jgi:flagellar motility protein MotE (MotC chaperone)
MPYRLSENQIGGANLEMLILIGVVVALYYVLVQSNPPKKEKFELTETYSQLTSSSPKLVSSEISEARMSPAVDLKSLGVPYAAIPARFGSSDRASSFNVRAHSMIKSSPRSIARRIAKQTPKTAAKEMKQVVKQLTPKTAVVVVTKAAQQMTPKTVAKVVPQLPPKVVAKVVPQLSAPAVAKVLPKLTTPVVAKVVPQLPAPVVAKVLPKLTTPVVAKVVPQLPAPVVAKVVPKLQPQVAAKVVPQLPAKVAAKIVAQVASPASTPKTTTPALSVVSSVASTPKTTTPASSVVSTPKTSSSAKTERFTDINRLHSVRDAYDLKTPLQNSVCSQKCCGYYWRENMGGLFKKNDPVKWEDVGVGKKYRTSNVTCMGDGVSPPGCRCYTGKQHDLLATRGGNSSRHY